MRRAHVHVCLILAFVVLASSLAGRVFAELAVADPPAPFSAKIVRFIDGDSVLVRTSQGEITETRIWGVDAPEFGEPWSRRAVSTLRSLTRGRTVLIKPRAFDRYGRIVAELFISQAASDTNVGLELIERGMAWVYLRYNRELNYIRAEASARSAGRGLWSDPVASRTPPWQTRHR